MRKTMLVWTTTRRAILAGVFLSAVAGAGQAATVRGRTGCAAPRGGGPATAYYFTVFNARIGRSKPAPVGGDGRFYLYNIPPGGYVLEAWSKVNPAQPPKVFQLTVFAPYTDVPALTLSCP